MDTTHFLHIANYPEKISKQNIEELEEVIKEYPFFQLARAIYVKALQNSNSFKFNNALKKAAAYTIDRKMLFELVTNPTPFDRFSKEFNLLEEEQEKTPILLKTNSSKEEAEKVLKKGSPIVFNSNEPHSFNEWLRLATYKPKNNKRQEIENHKTTIIDRFIELNPKIKPPDKTSKSPKILLEDIAENQEIMTETLAKVYLEQQKYDKAIQAYRILSLKYPKKSSFFANQIKAIQILQKK